MTHRERVALTLIVPVYNSSRFIETNLREAAGFLEQFERDWEMIVVDDCSSDDTVEVAKRVQSDFGDDRVLVLRNEVNTGKGHSVKRAMRVARGDVRVFSDADFTYPVYNIPRIVDAVRAGADVAVACRAHPDTRYIVPTDFVRVLLTRHWMGRLFNIIARLMLVGSVRDTQAGLKGFSGRAADLIFPQQTLTRFSFDVEVLFISRKLGMRIDEVGVDFIYSKEPSTIHFVRDTLKMLRDMTRIRVNAMRGRYSLPAPGAPIAAAPPAAAEPDARTHEPATPASQPTSSHK